MKTLVRIILVGLFALPLTTSWAAPTGYSVNSDEPDGDRLHAINLANGQATVKGLVQSLQGIKLDVEGMAFDKDGVLWAVDDESRTLFPVDTADGFVDVDEQVIITGLGNSSGNDFGMTFTCEGDLFISSVSGGELYNLSATGTATAIGSLGANISALAAYGNPTRLYGLGNGLLDDGVTRDNRSLYEIDLDTGLAMLIGKVGNQVSDYFEAGLSFDEEGNLWAMTDRRLNNQAFGSQIFRMNTTTGRGTLVSTTTVTGFESLAVSSPMGCDAEPEPPFIPRDPNPTGYMGIPTMGEIGSGIMILALMLTGLIVLRQRF